MTALGRDDESTSGVHFHVIGSRKGSQCSASGTRGSWS